jgi:hypothetical protein
VASSEAPLGGLTMERFPTWCVWQRLHGHLPEGHYRAYRQVLRLKGHALSMAAFSHVLVWMFMNVVFSKWLLDAGIYDISSVLILRLAITGMSLFFAVKVATAISKQREFASFDLFRILPRGELTTVFNIARVYRDPRDGMIRDYLLGLVFAFIIAGYTWVNPVPVTPDTFLGITLFVDYLQSFVTATLIAFIVTQHQERIRALLWLVIGFLVMQVMLYLGLTLALERLMDLEFVSQRINPDTDWRVYEYWRAILQPLVFIFCRELVNLALWQAVKRRLEA